MKRKCNAGTCFMYSWLEHNNYIDFLHKLERSHLNCAHRGHRRLLLNYLMSEIQWYNILLHETNEYAFVFVSFFIILSADSGHATLPAYFCSTQPSVCVIQLTVELCDTRFVSRSTPELGWFSGRAFARVDFCNVQWIWNSFLRRGFSISKFIIYN